MADPIWRIRVSTANGVFRYQLDMGSLKVDGSPVMNVDGNGNCTECTFSGDVDIGPREEVQVQYSLDGGTSWLNRFLGIATQVKSPQAFFGGYKLVGLMKKLEEADAGPTLAQGDLAGQVQQLLTDLITSGKVGTLFDPTILTVGTYIPLTSGRVVPNHQKVSEVLKTVLCPRLEKSQVAVNADGKLLFGIPDGVLALDEISPDVQPVEWADIDAEELITDLLLIWPKPLGGTLRYRDGTLNSSSRPNEFVVQDLQNTISSERVTGPVEFTSGGVALPPRYGRSVLPLGVTLDSSNFRRFPANNVTISPEAYTVIIDPNAPQPGYTTSGDQASLADGDRNTGLTLNPDPSAGGYAQVGVALDYSLGLGPPIGIEFAGDNVSLRAIGINDGQRGLFVLAPAGASGFYLIPDEVRAVLAASTSPNGPTLSISLLVTDSRVPILLRAASLMWVDPAFSAPLMTAALRLPAAAVGTVVVNGWPDTKPQVSVQRRGLNQEALDVVTLPASYSYRVNEGGALETEIKLGQRDAPDAAAAAALIKMRDKAAALGAIRVSSSA